MLQLALQYQRHLQLALHEEGRWARRMRQQGSQSLFANEQLRVLHRPVMHQNYFRELQQKQF